MQRDNIDDLISDALKCENESFIDNVQLKRDIRQKYSRETEKISYVPMVLGIIIYIFLEVCILLIDFGDGSINFLLSSASNFIRSLLILLVILSFYWRNELKVGGEKVSGY